MYEHIYQQIIEANLPQSTERVALALLGLAANLNGQINMPFTEFLLLCNVTNRRAALRHLTRMKQLGLIRYHASTQTRPHMVNITFRAWIPEIAPQEIPLKTVAETASETASETRAEKTEDGKDTPPEATHPPIATAQPAENMPDVVLKLLNTSQELVQSALFLMNNTTRITTLPQPIHVEGIDQSSKAALPVAPPQSAPNSNAQNSNAKKNNVMTQTTQQGQRITVELDTQQVAKNAALLQPIRVPLGESADGATLVIQVNVEKTSEKGQETEPDSSSSNNPQPDPQTKKPKTAPSSKKSTRIPTSGYPSPKPPIMHKSAEEEPTVHFGENQRAHKKNKEEKSIYIKDLNNKTDIQTDSDKKEDILYATAAQNDEASPEPEAQPTIALEEQDRTFKLLTDPEVGITEFVARRMSKEHRFEWIRGQVFAWREDLRTGKMHNAGALVYRINHKFGTRELTNGDRASSLYKRHRSPFEVDAEAKAQRSYAEMVEKKVVVKNKAAVKDKAAAKDKAAVKDKAVAKDKAESKVDAMVEVMAERVSPPQAVPNLATVDPTLWPQVLAAMAETLPLATYESYLSDTQLVGIEADGTHVIRASDSYSAGYLNQRLRGLLRRMLGQTMGDPNVKLRIETAQQEPEKKRVSRIKYFMPSGRNRTNNLDRLRANASNL